YEGVAGLPALRALHFGFGVDREMLAKLLQSPLARRLEEISVFALLWPKPSPPLPNLRRLVLPRFCDPATAKALAPTDLRSLTLHG
ncbi:hypothetical protein N4G37_14050, partial [Enterococcus faecalis]|uniref:hypothetical protein n=1 Tax=Enterococcus faecalis TaxID=1351 RepID=UPI0021B11C38